MSTYPGNPALGDEVKQRIVATYEQSLDLAERGRREEALLGCDFVLELDPQFAPAGKLRERLAGAGTGTPELADMRLGEEPPGAEAEPWAAAPGDESAGGRPEESFEGLFDLDVLALPELEEPPAPQGPLEPPAAGGGLAEALRARRAARDFRGVIELAGAERDAVAADPELGRLAEAAQARLEAEPYVESFLDKAGAALAAGDAERARVALEKARSLDPDHPRLAELEAAARAAAPVPEAGEILGGYELPEVESGGDGRIPELLAEGRGAAERGDYQGAIDAWSRIFLIDVDHEEAARRIEEVRRLKAEREREVEEIFHEGLAALERGDRDGARERFERVLAVQPNHLAARDSLRQMEGGEPVRLPTAPSAGDTVGLGGLGGLGALDLGDLAGPREGPAPGELTEEILVPPPPGSLPAQEEAGTAALPSYGKAAVGREPGRRSFLLVGGLVLALVAAAAVLVVLNKDSWFPNSDVAQPVVGAPGEGAAPGPIERAIELHEGGQTAMAVGVLRRLRPDDPRHAEAQELIALWETPSGAEAEEAAQPVAPTALARRGRLLAAAGAAHEEGDHLLADELLDRAARVAELEGPDLELERAVERALAPLAAEITLFREGEYEMALPRLWRLYEADPSDRDVRRMLVGSYYNRGVRQLQRGDPAGAAREFEEALEIAPGDPDLERHYLFAQTYERRPRDLLYRIYVKYLPVR
ncbi:MAG TPA: hypothetical protein VM599_06775 [Thermoanaerobaculia bacterium]|nr:hypothetical protein [Thermoanaerobaculia bacterium]